MNREANHSKRTTSARKPTIGQRVRHNGQYWYVRQVYRRDRTLLIERMGEQTQVNYRPKGVSRNREKTHCLHGHRFSGENLILLPNGWRKCRRCAEETRRKRRERQGDLVPCMICGRGYTKVLIHLARSSDPEHAITPDAYKRLYPDAPLTATGRRDTWSAAGRDTFVDRVAKARGTRVNYDTSQWTKANVIAWLHAETERRGHPPRTTARRKTRRSTSRPKNLYLKTGRRKARPAPATLIRLFGSVAAAYEAAGLPIPQPNRGSKPKAKCRRGHPLTPDNVYLNNGIRHCRACMAIKKPRGKCARPGCGKAVVATKQNEGKQRYCSRRCSRLKSACKRGHPRTPANLTTDGHCRACRALLSGRPQTYA